MLKKGEKITKLKVSLDGDSLYVKTCGEEDFKEHLIFFHDIGEYHERYSDFIDYLYERNISTTIIDLRGHGLSNGSRGLIPSVDSIFNDNKIIHEYLKSVFPEQRKIIAGHGVGALIALDFFVTYNEFDGLALFNPSLKFNETVRLKIDSVFSRIGLIDKIKINHLMNLDDLSDNVELVRNHKHDPLINRKISLSTFKAIEELIEKSKSNIYYVNKPTYIAVGEDNHLLDIEALSLFTMSVEKKYLTNEIFKSIGHEIFNELDRHECFNSMYNWIEKNFRR
ncbi:serine aminopeptidase domain-containing protein [Bacteriovorax sp. Seq25_V]|uniref:serine aminopeptidase domain-containing protein n=1 Tax=Bacteriovorax sp. Seq25_V TaxID=1201288 RepID=UPI000389FA77|nr:alpha/beta hydrolase [Bacteriovorax sp. Seq25_V]EQC45355.1 putative lysophospholipase [Bacteriovorax sp. Seq25_V]